MPDWMRAALPKREAAQVVANGRVHGEMLEWSKDGDGVKLKIDGQKVLKWVKDTKWEEIPSGKRNEGMCSFIGKLWSEARKITDAPHDVIHPQILSAARVVNEFCCINADTGEPAPLPEPEVIELVERIGKMYHSA